MRKIIGWLVILLMAIWTVVSWYWYTCKIKGFCRQKIEKQVVVTPVVSVPQEPVVVLDLETPKPVEVKKPLVKIEEPKKECTALLTQYIKLGEDNDKDSVKKLENFLNDYEGQSVKVDGIYSTSDDQKVRAFQSKYKKDILEPIDLDEPTGNVLNMTVKKINELYCSQN